LLAKQLGAGRSRVQFSVEYALGRLSTHARARMRAWLDFERFWPSVLWPPTLGGGGLFALASLGYLQARWAALPAVLLAAGAVRLLWRVDGNKEGGRLIRPIGLPATVWLGAAWWWGPQRPLLVGWLAGLWLLATGLWLAHLRGWLQRRGPAHKDRLAEVLADWPAQSARIGLGGVEVADVRAEGEETTVLLALDSGHTFRDVAAKVETLEVLVQSREGAVRVSKGHLAHLCHFHVRPRDPWREWLPWPGPSGNSWRTPIVPAYRAGGEPVRVCLQDSDALIGGVKGSGKSRFVVAWIVDLAYRRDVLLFGMDVAKRGVEFGQVEPLFWRLAKTHEGARAMFEDLARIHLARNAWMNSRGLTEWPVSPQYPQIVVVIDELTVLMEVPGLADQVNRLSLVCRQQGITLVGATQLLFASTLGDSLVVRKQAGVRACLRVAEKGDAVPVFGHDGVAEGWRPDRLGPHKGLVLVQSDENPDPMPARAWLLPSGELQRLVEEAAELRPLLEEPTQQALRERIPLAETVYEPTPDERFEELLSGAPPEGMEFGAIVDAMKPWMSRGTVFNRLRDRGRKVSRGRWLLAGSVREDE
jgi:hypothetical protein